MCQKNMWSLEDLVAHGYSGAQAGFFNFVLKGKLKITRDQFIDEYCVKLTPLKDIEKKYGISYGNITFVREYFGIKRIGSKGLKRGKEEIDLTDTQKQVLYGTLMGDSCRFGNGICFKHCFDQREYLEHLFSMFKEHCTENPIKIRTDYDDRYDSKSIVFSFYTKNHRQIKRICDEFYKDDRKSVFDDVLKKLTPMSIAYWMMDDGLSEMTRNGRTRDYVSMGISKIYEN